jgi:hypothetical protein
LELLRYTKSAPIAATVATSEYKIPAVQYATWIVELSIMGAFYYGRKSEKPGAGTRLRPDVPHPVQLWHKFRGFRGL